MSYSFGDITIHFTMAQGDAFVASWDGGQSANKDWNLFIGWIHQQTGINKEEINKSAAKCYGLTDAG